jgi:hypothetical protein
MKKSYLPSENKELIKDYSKKDSYLHPEQPTEIEKSCIILPEEYSVFSKIDQRLFAYDDTKQHRLISKCLVYMKEQLVLLYLTNDIICILPKLQCINEEDGSIILNWAYSGYRIFFSFDDDESGAAAFCGVIVQNDEESISTQSKKLNLKNYKSIINSVMKVVIENS